MRVLGIDTSLRSTGLGLVQTAGSRYERLAGATLKVRASHPHSACLLRIHDGISRMLRAGEVDAAAIEGAFYCKNVKTAMILGEARGTAIAACALASVPVYEYAPRRVKQALVGFGGASKEQVRKMVMNVLGLQQEPGEDEGDALALALCHLNSSRHHALLAADPL